MSPTIHILTNSPNFALCPHCRLLFIITNCLPLNPQTLSALVVHHSLPFCHINYQSNNVQSYLPQHSTALTVPQSTHHLYYNLFSQFYPTVPLITQAPRSPLFQQNLLLAHHISLVSHINPLSTNVIFSLSHHVTLRHSVALFCTAHSTLSTTKLCPPYSTLLHIMLHNCLSSLSLSTTVHHFLQEQNLTIHHISKIFHTTHCLSLFLTASIALYYS